MSQISVSMPASPIYSSPSSPTSPSWHSRAVTSPSARHLESLPPTEIVDRVFISDMYAAESAVTLASLRITHVVSVMRGRIILPSNMGLKHFQLPVEDNPFAELATLLPSSTTFILNALDDPNARVLVHCAQGISRSSSVVCALLIAKEEMTLDEALNHLKSKWSQADPNPGFIQQLGEYARSLPQKS